MKTIIKDIQFDFTNHFSNPYNNIKNENKYHENDISEELKCDNENKIRLCDEILRELIKLQNIGDI